MVIRNSRFREHKNEQTEMICPRLFLLCEKSEKITSCTIEIESHKGGDQDADREYDATGIL